MDTKADEKDVDNITEDDHSDTLLESDLEDISKEIKAPKEKKSRKSYTYIPKAEILDQFFKEKAHDNCLSLSVFGEEVGVNKSMLTRWIQDKDNIFQNASQDKLCYLKKGRGSTKHLKTFPKLYEAFIKMRDNGHKVSFNWFWIKGKIVAKKIGAPLFTRRATQSFIAHYNLKVRRVQRKKQNDKSDFLERMKQWHLNYREALIKSGNTKPTYDPKWGRFKPHQRLNVDQVPLPFALDKKTTYERPLSQNEKVWIAMPGSGLDKRQCTLQICFSPEGNHVKIEIIFRGKGKVSKLEKKAYHKAVDVYFQDNAWADTEFSCKWVERTLKSAIPLGEEFVLICDNLNSQTSTDFKEAIRKINGIVYYGLPNATDIWQPVDAGYGYLVKKLVAKAQDKWLESDENIDRWMGNGPKPMTASDRRILITDWVGEAFEELKKSDYDNMRKRCFEKTGCLLTADGSNDDLVQPEGLIGYKVMPPLSMHGPDDYSDIKAPEPASDPPDTMPEDEDNLFSSNDQEESLNSDLESEDALNLDLESEEAERIDNEEDRTQNHKLVGQQIRGLYETGWHNGKIEYFNLKLKEFFVLFEDDTSDYLREEEIDGYQIILKDVSKVSGRVRNTVNYRKFADI